MVYDRDPEANMQGLKKADDKREPYKTRKLFHHDLGSTDQCNKGWKRNGASPFRGLRRRFPVSFLIASQSVDDRWLIYDHENVRPSTAPMNLRENRRLLSRVK